ncbi:MULTISPECIES: hypothetical protein [Parachlamydia]|uniref:Uncharacterized protein n=1 Tax=Parachlamydia acanthamoebae (strain UV7) TaxID=765952 RepID=F8KZD3_PARAV|nr:hypothetical protein [Parachlamydia acanthamoebae]EFB41842.1 hypothetical protein pah_c022o140 [Parachlamydia acanthamoebae str. Hall's coccus]CCB86273.1 putative uncharacterized protein [Parachlamydia acanthamoebae UV-7]
MLRIQRSLYFQIVDLYPEKLKPSILYVKSRINEVIHRFMTGQVKHGCSPDFELQKQGFKYIAGEKDTKIFSINENSSWIIKTQRPNFYKQFIGVENKQGKVVFDLEGCFMKQAVLAWEMRKIIHIHKFDKLNVTKKYLCSYPNNLFKPKDGQSKNYFFFEEYVQIGSPKEKIATLNSKSPEEIQMISKQLCGLVKKTGYTGLDLDNLAVDDRVTLFDTKPMKLSRFSRICISKRLKCARIGLQSFSDSLMGYASQNPGEYQAFKIFQEDCAKTIKEIKKEEKKRTVIVILKVLSCVSLLPIPIYLTLYFAKRTYSNKQTRKTLMAALQAD